MELKSEEARALGEFQSPLIEPYGIEMNVS